MVACSTCRVETQRLPCASGNSSRKISSSEELPTYRSGCTPLWPTSSNTASLRDIPRIRALIDFIVQALHEMRGELGPR